MESDSEDSVESVDGVSYGVFWELIWWMWVEEFKAVADTVQCVSDISSEGSVGVPRTRQGVTVVTNIGDVIFRHFVLHICHPIRSIIIIQFRRLICSHAMFFNL